MKVGIEQMIRRLALLGDRRLALCGILLLVAACSSQVGGPSRETLDAKPVSPEALAVLGAFEEASTFEAQIDSATALADARTADFGRDGKPEVSLVRATAPGELVPVAKDVLVWVYHWGGLNEEEHVAFPGADGKPQATVFLHSNYYLVVDAATGQVIVGVLIK